MYDEGSIIRCEFKQCPFCHEFKEKQEEATREECSCGGVFSAEYDNEQDIWVIEKILK